MESFSARPLLLVDADGVVSLFGLAHVPPAGLLPAALDGIPHLLSEHAGQLPARLSATFESLDRSRRPATWIDAHVTRLET